MGVALGDYNLDGHTDILKTKLERAGTPAELKAALAQADPNVVVVVDTPDALLVADRKRAQQVGDLVKLLEKSGHHHLL